MPNQPKTPTRSVRVGAHLWNAARTKAVREGVTVTDIIVAALTAYTQEPNSPPSSGTGGAFT